MSPSSEPRRGIVRELSQGVLVLALTGSCFGGVVGMLGIAARALGR